MDLVILHRSPAGASTSAGVAATLDVAAVRFRDEKQISTNQWCLTYARDAGTETTTDSEDERDKVLEFLQFTADASLGAFEMSHLHDIDELCASHGYGISGLDDALDFSSMTRILKPTVKETGFWGIVATLEQDGTAVEPSDAEQRAEPVRALCLLYNALLHAAETLPYITLQQLAGLAGLWSHGLAGWFNHMAEVRFNQSGTTLPEGCDVIQQLAFSSPNRTYGGDNSGSMADSDALDMDGDQLFHQDSPLRELLPGFEVRPGQMQMAEAVRDALDGDEHLLVEAGTGTGKSLAYLIPAALFAKQHDTRVVVSTHTIALQDQIENRDFPMLRQVLPFPVSLAVFKGRTHYVCMRKVLQEVRAANIGTSQEELEGAMKLLVWLVHTPGGNREELPLRGRFADMWMRVQSETETCIGKRCPFFKPCYYFRARAKAYEADVVVTNHSLVFSDLKADHRVLPKYDKLILDEAHHLESEATKHLGDEVNWFQCLALIGRLTRDNGRHGVVSELLSRLHGSDVRAVSAIPALEDIQDLLRSLRASMDDAFTTLSQLVPPGQSDARLTRDIENSPVWSRYLKVCDDMMSFVQELEEKAGVISDIAERETDEDLGGRMFDAIGFLSELFGHVQVLCTAGDMNDDWVAWVEVAGRDGRQVSLQRAPIDVAHILRNSLFEPKSTVILTSATLSVDGKFDYPIAHLGLQQAKHDMRLRTLTVPSPFRLNVQALLCVPNDVPELARMSAEEAATWMSDSLYQLAKISGGRLLALFTSHAMLRATAEALRQPLKELGQTLYAQGVDGSRTHLLEMFKRYPKSVLLGAQSFWEGIDLPGDQLTTLVIVRLPFSPPTHPVTQARHERLEKQGFSSFAKASLPEAIVRFRQGFGRLIRTVHDRGVVVVYDKRIVTARYGQSFVQSLGDVRPYVGKERDVMERIRQFLGAPDRS